MKCVLVQLALAKQHNERERNEAKLKGKASVFLFFCFYPALVLLQYNLRTQVLLLTVVIL